MRVARGSTSSNKQGNVRRGRYYSVRAGSTQPWLLCVPRAQRKYGKQLVFQAQVVLSPSACCKPAACATWGAEPSRAREAATTSMTKRPKSNAGGNAPHGTRAGASTYGQRRTQSGRKRVGWWAHTLLRRCAVAGKAANQHTVPNGAPKE